MRIYLNEKIPSRNEQRQIQEALYDGRLFSLDLFMINHFLKRMPEFRLMLMKRNSITPENEGPQDFSLRSK